MRSIPEPDRRAHARVRSRANLGWRTASLAFLAFSAFSSAPSPLRAHAEEAGERVYFGGIAFTGSLADADHLLPHARTALQQVGLLRVNQLLMARLAARPPEHFRLDPSGLATLDGSTSATAMAVAIDRETVVIEKIGNQNKLLFELAVQVLFFDFRDRQVRFALPVTIQRIEVTSHPPGPDDVGTLVAEILVGEGPATLASAVSETLQPMRLPRAAARRLQVVDVSPSDQVDTAFPAIAERVRAGVLGHEFSKILSSGLQLALLPYRSGHAIGGVLPTRFSDGRVYNLTVPEPDYVIRLELEDFRGKTLRETPALRQELLGAFFHVLVEEPLSRTRYFDRSLRFGATKTIPATQEGFDHSAGYYETLLAGLATFTEAVAGGAEQWVKDQQDRADVRRELRALGELVELCR